MTQAQPHAASDRVLTRLMRLHPKKIDLNALQRAFDGR